MIKDTKSWSRLSVTCLLAMTALWLVPAATADPGNGNAVSHQTEGTAATTGDPTKPQPPSNADYSGNGANKHGAYDSTRDGSASQNGKGDGEATGKPCAGCVGKADNKNPEGQKPNGSDPNAGYECDRNQGIGQTNPAHTGCKDPPPCTVNCTPPPPGCKTNCTPPPGCVKDCTPPPPGCKTNCTPPPGCVKDCTPPPPGCKTNCTPPPVCKVDCTPKKDVCVNIKGVQTKVPVGMTRDARGRCAMPPVKTVKKIDVCKNLTGMQVKTPAGMKRVDGKCANIGIHVKRASVCRALLSVTIKARKGTLVTIKGAGLSLTRKVGAKGVLVLKLHPRGEGIITVEAAGQTKRVGISCGSEGTQLTG